MVLDTSVVLAVLFAEPMASWVKGEIESRRGGVAMCTINYAEALILSCSRFPRGVSMVQQAVERSHIELIAPTARHAEMAALARLQYPLNLGDCFAYALAKDWGVPLLTLDRDFRGCDIEVVLPRIH